MTHYLYAFRNKVGLFYSKLWSTGENESVMMESFERNITCAPEAQLDSLIEDDLYFLGTYDDNTGVIVSDVRFLMDASVIVKQVKALRAIKVDNEDDGKQETDF